MELHSASSAPGAGAPGPAPAQSPAGPPAVSGAEAVIRGIQEDILEGRLRPGDRLPAERQLTEAYGVGRPALREALKALEIIGLIQRRHGSGNYISPNLSNHFYQPLAIAYKLTGGRVADVLQLRYLLEGMAVRGFCQTSGSAPLAELRAVHGKLAGVDNAADAARFDREFHHIIASHCGNPLALVFLQSISRLLESLFSQTATLALSEDLSYMPVVAEHEAVLKALEARDADAAEAAMKAHLDMIRHAYLTDD